MTGIRLEKGQKILNRNAKRKTGNSEVHKTLVYLFILVGLEGNLQWLEIVFFVGIAIHRLNSE